MSEAETPIKAEETEGKKKKKGGKLPVILAILLLLGGGGFFAMKMKAKGAAKEPEIKLGEIVPLKEYLVNLRTGTNYARAEIAVQLREGYAKEKLETIRPAVDDAVNMVLKGHTVDELESPEGLDALKKELAERINAVLDEYDPEHKSKKEEPAKGKEPANGREGAPAANADAKLKDPKPDESKKSWQSLKGPVLKVFFTSFATQ